MDRIAKIKQCFNAESELTITNDKYKDFTDRHFDFLLEMDLGTGDSSQYPHKFYKKQVKSAIIVKENGIVAGLEEIIYLLKKHKIEYDTKFQDGDTIKIGDVLIKIKGESGKILSLERTILNVLQRLCGIASTTAKYKQRIPKNDCFVIGTRKTLWGFWDKKAIQCGGGLTHRLNLEDAAMLKENHLNIIKANCDDDPLFVGLDNVARNNPRLRFIEVEVTNEDEFWEAAYALSKVMHKVNKVIMFDHFTIKQIKNIIEEMKTRGLHDEILLETSGNIDLESIGKFAESGVDVISSGALTHSVKALDLSLLFDYQ